MEPITSRQNPHVKKLMGLHTREERERLQQFLCEGEKEIALAPAIETLYYTKKTPFFLQMAKKAKETICLSEELLEKVSYRGNNLIAVCQKRQTKLSEMHNKKLLLICEGIEKPGNLGGMLRTADSAGVDGIIVADPVVDLFNPNVVRASLGAIFCRPIAQATKEETIAFVKEEHMQVVLATPHTENLYYDIDFTKPTCIVIGSESEGLSLLWQKETSFFSAKIPMLGQVDSLNASISASIFIYEALRQRHTLS